MTGRRVTKYGTLLSVVLALFLTMALAACSGEGDPRGEGTPGSLLEQAAEGEATQEAGDPEPTRGPTSVATDREALVALYNATDGPNWDSNYDWLSDAPLDEWYGVYTNDDGRVTELELEENQLSGEIPPELGNLANLIELWLHDNQLSGEIPPELGNLANLTGLWLSNNELSGEIPPELDNLANLRDLWLGNNDLSGEIPPELGNLANLEGLLLHENQLSGEIPPELGNLANLIGLSLHENQLSGDIPPEMGSLANLKLLSLHETQLSGCVPSSLEDPLDLSESELGDLDFC